MADRREEPPAQGAAGALDLGWNLGVLFQRYLELARVAFADLPGGPRGYQVLARAEREGVSSQAELANRLGIDRTVMTYLLDELVEAGLVVRRVDPSDRRARRVTATAKGRRLLPQLDRRLAMVQTELLAGLPEADADTLASLLRRAASTIAGDTPFDPTALAEELVRPGHRPR